MNYRFKVLPRKEQHELYHKMKAGDNNARQQLIESVIPLGYNIARKMKNCGIDDEDLESESVLAVIKAVDNWDIKRATLTTVVHPYVRRHLLEYIGRYQSPFTTTCNILSQPPDSEVRQQFGKCLKTYRYGRGTVPSGNRETGKEIKMKKLVEYDDLHTRHKRSRKIDSLISCLPDIENKVIRARFGIDRNKILKSEIKKEFGFSPSRLYQHACHAIKVLKSNFNPDLEGV